MTKNLVFKAQALDNSSPDPVELRGEQLAPDDSAKRQEAASLVSSVIKSGSRIYEKDGVLLTEDGRRFVVEVPSVERDVVGRIAPIICCGNYDSTVDDAFSATVVVDLNDFSKRIGRNILPKHIQLAQESFTVLKKKSGTRKLLRLVWVGAAVLGVLTLAYLILSTGS